MAAKYRVGIIGNTGRGNYGHGIDTVWQHFEQVAIVGVADPDEKGRAAAATRLKAPKAFADYRQLLDETKPQIVAICPRWLDQHRDLVLAAAERGMHIYMEKPMCRSLAEADQMVAACQKHNVKLALAHQTRYSPRLQAVSEIIGSGQLGTLLELRGRGKEDQRGGSEDLWVLGSHVFNLIHHFGGDPKWCFGRLEQGGKPVSKEVRDARFCAAVKALMLLPGRRLFQYRDAEGAVHTVRADDVNAYLCSIAGRRISLKDFRTLVASSSVLEALAATEPATSERGRRSQLRAAVIAVADELTNTPTVCRKSYVHEAVVTAFEEGALARLGKPSRSAAKKAEVLARIVARHSS